jgi:negative regulator of sigma E activity
MKSKEFGMLLRSMTGLLGLGLTLSTCFASAEQGDTKLEASLKRLDVASARFSSAQAVFHKDLYNKLVGDHTPQDGSVYFIRTGGSVQMGARIDGPGARIAEYKNGVLRDLIPGRCYNTVQASGNKAKFDSFLTLGFGGSGKDLEQAWNIVDMGQETLDGAKVEKLELVSKEQSVRNNYTKVTLWMDLDRGISLKQVLLSPSGDIDTATYTKIRLNEKNVDKKPFEIKGSPCK